MSAATLGTPGDCVRVKGFTDSDGLDETARQQGDVVLVRALADDSCASLSLLASSLIHVSHHRRLLSRDEVF
jgi:hypothetical protein